MPVLATLQVVALSPRSSTCLLLGIFPTLSKRTIAVAEARISKGFMDNLPATMSARVVCAHVPLAIVLNA